MYYGCVCVCFKRMQWRKNGKKGEKTRRKYIYNGTKSGLNEAEPKTQSNERDGQFIMALWHMIRILFSELPARIVLIKCVCMCVCARVFVLLSHTHNTIRYSNWRLGIRHSV